MIRVNEDKYNSVIRNFAGSLFKTEAKGNTRSKSFSKMSVIQYKSKEGVTIAQMIVYPNSTIYHIRPAFINF